MNRWLVALVFVVVTWAGAFGIAFAVTEWRDDNDDDPPSAEAFDADACQAAVAFFRVIDSFVTEERLLIISALLEDSDFTPETAWNEAFANMVDRCGYVP